MADFDFSDVDRAFGLSTPGAEPATTGYDYASKSFNPQTIRKNPYFLDDLRRYYESKGISDRTDDELFNLLLDDDNVRTSNTFAPFVLARGSYADVANDAEEDKERFARLKTVVDQTPFFFQEGGRGLSALPSVAKGVLTDPLNLLSGGAAGAIGAVRGLRAGAAGVSAGRALLEGGAAGAKAGALFEGGVGALSGGISSLGEQKTRVELGLQDEVSPAMALEDAIVSGALSGTIGGFIGGIGGAVGSARGHQVATGLKTLGYTDDQIVSMSMRDGISALDNQLPPPAPPEAATAPESTEPQPVDLTKQVADLQAKQQADEQAQESLRLNSTREALRQYHKDLIGEQQDLLADDADERRIATVQSQIGQVSRLLEFHNRMAAERKQIDDLLASNEPGKLKEGERRRNIYERDLAAMKSLVERPVPEDMAKFIDERIAREDELAKAKEPAAAEATAPAGTPENAAPATADETAGSAPADTLADLIPDEAPAAAAEPAPKVKARTAIRDFATQNGVDITEVTPSGANGVVTKSDIKNHLAAKGPSASMVEAEDLIAEGIDTIERRFGNQPDILDAFRSDPAALTRFILQSKGIDDEAKAAAIRELLDVHSRTGIENEPAPIEFSASDKKRIRRRITEIKKNNPDTPDLMARDMAEREAVKFRSRNVGEGVPVDVGMPVRSTNAAIERAANLPTAGRAATGKIQSFLRPAATFNKGTDAEYSIAGRFTNTSGRRAATVGDIPSPSTLSFEEAYVRASSQKDTEYPVAFTADAPLGLADSPTPAQQGETLWVDGRSGKAFRDWRNIYQKYYGHIPTETPPQISRQLAAPGAPDLPEARLKTTGDLVAALGRGEISAQEFEHRLTKLTRAPATSVDLPPLQRDDGKVALFVRKTPGQDGTASSRKASPQDIASGLTAQDIIGRNSNIDDWHLVYVPADTPDTRAGRAVAARRAKPEPIAKRTPARGALDYDAYQRKVFYNADLTPEDWRALGAAASLQKNPDAALQHIKALQERNSGVSGLLLDRLLNNIEGGQLRAFNKDSAHTANWPSRESGRAGMVRLLTQLYDLKTRMAPDGVALPVADREAAVADIERIFKRSGPEQLKLARDFINDLNSNARPAFLSTAEEGTATTVAGGRSADRVGSVTFGKDFKSKREIPQIAVLYHEMAHWAYSNILTPEERLNFWDAMGKYYDENGTFTPREVAARSPLAKADGKVYGPTNALNSPAEFFANQFSMRMMQRSQLADPQGVWARITRFIKAIFDRFFDKNAIDPDLEPFFARILPDGERKAAEVRAYSTPAPTDSLADLIPDAETPASSPAVAQPASAPEPAARVRRDGPAQTFEGLTRDEFMERVHPSHDEDAVGMLYTNEQLLNDLETQWKRASDTNDPQLAIDAADETIRYLAGSAFSREQMSRLRGTKHFGTGDTRARKVFGPYQRAGKLPANMRNKVYDLLAIKRGHEVVGIEDADDATLLNRLSKVAGDDGLRTTGNVDEMGKRLLQLYRYGKQHPDGTYRKGSSLADVFNLAHKALYTSFDRWATQPRKGVVNTRIAAKGYTQVAIGKFVDTRVGDSFVRTSDKARADIFTVDKFVERPDGIRVAQMRMPDGSYEELTPENAREWRRGGTRGPNVQQVADDLAAKLDRAVATVAEERAKVVEKKKSEAKGRISSSDLAPARPDQPSPRTMPVEAIERVIADEADNVASDRAADDLITKEQTRVVVPTSKLPRSVPDDTDELAAYADEAFRMGDEDADNYAAALKARRKNEPLISFADDQTLAALGIEKNQTRTATRDIGVPGGVDSATRDILMGINHRKRRHTYNARTLAYRVLNLTDPNQDVTRGDVANWLGMDLDSGHDDLFGASGDQVYDQFRATFRRIGSFMEDAAADEGYTLGHAVNSLVSILYRMDGDLDAPLGVLPSEIADRLRLNNASDLKLYHAVLDKWVQDAVAHRLMGGSVKNARAPKMDRNASADQVARANALVSRLLDRLGYVTNGLISSGPVRDTLYRLTWYGDPFAEKVPASVLAKPSPTASLSAPLKAISTSRARFILDDIASALQARKDAISAFIGKNIDETPDAIQFYHVAADEPAPSFSKTDGRYGDAIYLKSEPQSGIGSKATSDFVNATRDPATKEEISQSIAELRELENSINSVAVDPSPAAQAALAKYLDREDALLSNLADHKVDGVQRVVPVAVRAVNSLNVSSSIDSPEKLRLFHEMFARHAGNKTVLLTELERATNGFAQGLRTNGTGSAPVSAYLNRIMQEAGDKGSKDKNGVARLLRAAGFDALKLPEGIAVFDPANLRVADDIAFDAPDVAMEGGQPLSMGGELLTRIAETTDAAIPAEKMPLTLGPLSQAEPFRPITNFMGNMLRGRRPTPDDSDAVIRFGSQNFLANTYKFGKGILRSNSESLRTLGMNWMADWFESTFQDTTQSMAKMLQGTVARPGPLAAINDLPDASGFVKNQLRQWFRSVSMDGLGTRKWGADQPESHKRILRALRAKNPRAWSSLSADERRAAEIIRRQFRDTLDQLRANGVEVGDLGTDYFPQVWSSQSIRKNKDGFIGAMSNYLRAEAKAAGRPVDEGKIASTASTMYTRMSDSETEGLFMDAFGQSRKSSAENIDYSRLLKLDALPEGEALKGYLEDDLSAILVKYYDAAARRLKQVEKFGNKSHGAYDYLRVVREGRDGIAYLLANNRVERSINTVMGRDGVEDITIASNFSMPFQGNDYGAQKAATQLMELHDQFGPVVAREYLMQMAPTDMATGLPSIPYRRRVDAIVAALDDFGGVAQDITQDAYGFFENVLTLANRKPLPSSQVARGASRFIRNFNSVSLLGFTLLTSLSDPALPIIRSGSMRTAIKAMRAMAADPEYRRIIYNVGASMESMMHDRMTHLWGGVDGKVSNAFFSGVGLTPWTDVMRGFAASVGYETFAALQAKALKAYTPGQPVNAQSRQFKQAYRILKQYGLEHYATNTTQSLADRSLIESDDLLRTAMIRFADDSIFAPNANEIPVWAQSPLGKVVFQFKAYPLMMMRLTKEVMFDDVRLAIYDALGKTPPSNIKGSGNLNRAKYLLTLAPLLGAGALFTKDVVQGRGEDKKGNYQHKPRTALASNILPLGGPMDNETVDMLAGWYLEGFGLAGGMGLMLETLHNVLAQADNGAYGAQRAASAIFGPSVGTGVSAFNVLGGIDDAIMDRTPNANGKERLAVRELATRIPVLGGMPTIREDIVDAVAGEKERRQTQRAAKAGKPNTPDYGQLF